MKIPGNGGGGMTGPAMLMKALGLDPAEIMGQVEQAKVSASQVMQHFDLRLKTIEAQQAQILAGIEMLLGKSPGVQ